MKIYIRRIEDGITNNGKKCYRINYGNNVNSLDDIMYCYAKYKNGSYDGYVFGNRNEQRNVELYYEINKQIISKFMKGELHIGNEINDFEIIYEDNGVLI